MTETILTTWKRPPYWLLGAWLLICFAVAALGNLVTLPEIPTWYASLTKPVFNPPSWIFGPVWTTLYIFMAVAAWRIEGVTSLTEQLPDRRLLTWVFLIQLVLNGIWSPIFFGWHLIGAAAIIILLLWLSIATFIKLTWNRERIAAYLFIPYLCWVSFAMVLNFTIWQLNS